MPTFYFKKLVRDKVLERCLEDPKVEVTYHTLDSQAYIEELIKKLHEEVDEVTVGLDEKEVLSEIADVQEVLDSLVTAYGLTKEAVAGAQGKKLQKNGGFDGQAYIEKVELDDDSEWVAIFREQPDKYKEA